MKLVTASALGTAKVSLENVTLGLDRSALKVAGGVEPDAVERVGVRLAVGEPLISHRRMVTPLTIGRAGRDGIGANLLVGTAVDRDEHLEIGEQPAAGIAAGEVEGEGSRRAY